MGRREKQLTPRDLARAVPRQLEDWCDARGIEIPVRATSTDMRQLIFEHDRAEEDGRTVTTADVPAPGVDAVAAAADPAKAVSPLDPGAPADEQVAEDEAEVEDVEGEGRDKAEGEAPTEDEAGPDYEAMTVKNLKVLADNRKLEVKGKGKKRPAKPDYVKALSADDEA